jgi:hypothetical protein
MSSIVAGINGGASYCEGCWRGRGRATMVGLQAARRRLAGAGATRGNGYSGGSLFAAMVCRRAEES